jgi:3-oxosteroid 1-dehydrogenase
VADTWDYETDYLVVGTGAAGLSAAITASRNGLDVIVTESMPTWGGTTAISGGGLWMPANPLMHRDGIQDSIPEALAYMERTVGDLGPWTSTERKKAFLVGIPNYMNMMTEEGLRWARATEYPDYYPDIPGGKIGRAVEVYPFNTRKLGSYRKLMTPGGLPVPAMTNDIWLLSRAWSTPDGFIRGARFVFRFLGKLLTGQQSVGMGGALASSLMHVVRKRNIPVWLNSPLVELIREGDRVVGAVIEKEGTRVRIRAEKGVMLAAGGFARNKEWRQKYHGVDGMSSAPAGQLGQGISIGEKAGGYLAMMDDAWWGATTADTTGSGQHGFILNERSDPWSIVVDQDGKRYLNESESYVDFGHDMIRHQQKTGKAYPSWMVLDKRHTQHFLNSAFLVPGAKKKLIKSGDVVIAKSVGELAKKMAVKPEVLQDTVERFNEFAREGVDRDFGRGRTTYDNYYGNPLVHPNPNLGTIEKGPFTAVKVYLGDLNTKGGLVTDEFARVVKKNGDVIEGLYAAGNNTASVMGHTYPGAGSTIAPASVFGYIGALHAARPADHPTEEWPLKAA